MASSVRGLTVEISADASTFNKEMNNLRNEAKNSRAELNALQKSLELEYDEGTFVNAQETAQKAIDQTAKNAEVLRDRLDYLEETGNIDTDEYQKLHKELLQTEVAGKQLQQNLEKLNEIRLNNIVSNAAKATDEFKKLKENLKLEFNEAGFVKSQKAAKTAIEENNGAAEKLKSILKELESSGKMNTSEYEATKKKLSETEKCAAELKEEIKSLNDIKLADLGKTVSDLGGKISNAGKALAPLSTAAAGAITSFAALGKNAISSADNVATLATQYEMSSEALQRFNYVALQTDTQSEDLYKAFVKVRAGVADIGPKTAEELAKTEKSISDLKNKLKTLEKAGKTDSSSYETARKKLEELQNQAEPTVNSLQKLGLDFESFDSSEEQFYAIIDALSSMEDQTQMVYLANDIFGDKLANNLLPLIYAGTDAVSEYRAEYEELGSLSDEQVGKLAEFDNVLNKLHTQFQNVALQIGSALLPVMESIADIAGEKIVPKLQKLTEWFNSLSSAQLKFGLTALSAAAATAPLIMGVGKIVSSVGNIISALPKLGSTLSSLAAHPVILVVAAVAALLVLLYTKCEAFRESINNLVSTLASSLSPILQTLKDLFMNIMQILTPVTELLGTKLAKIITALTDDIQILFSVIGEILSSVIELLMPVIEMVGELTTSLIETLFPAILPILEILLGILNDVFAALIPIFDIVGGLLSVLIELIMSTLMPIIGIVGEIFTALTPVFELLSKYINSVLPVIKTLLMALFEILKPILSIALIPIKIAIKALQTPLKALGNMLKWLAPVFETFGNIVTTVFSKVGDGINAILGFIEDMVNGAIGIINDMIDGVNDALGFLGVNIGKVKEIKLRFDKKDLKNEVSANLKMDSPPEDPKEPEEPEEPENEPDGDGGNNKDTPKYGGTVYDTGAKTTTGYTYNNDYSTNNKTQNVTVVIQNYAQEVDVDNLVREINIKLAEQM